MGVWWDVGGAEIASGGDVWGVGGGIVGVVVGVRVGDAGVELV